MIKSGEYIQLLQFFSDPRNINFVVYYSGLQSIEVIEGCKRFDELRILHNKYKSHGENYNVYPNKDLTEMKMIENDILRICNEFRIKVIFNQRGTLKFKNDIHADYFFENRCITDLIIFHNKRKPSSVSH